MNLNYTFDNIRDFYLACETITEDGDRVKWESTNKRDDKAWIGLSNKDIKESKWSYEKGLDQLKEIENDLPVGGSKAMYKYDEFDGDDMNYDRMLEGQPCMKKRVKTSGVGTGKIINIHINVAECCDVEYTEFLSKAYTAMRLVDYLEERGYRVGIYTVVYARNVGTYKGKDLDDFLLEVCIKKHEDPIIKPLILTCISPWFFRFHVFQFWEATLKPRWGYGCSKKMNKQDTTSDIYIDNGECLNEHSAKDKIDSIMKLFNDVEETAD